MHVCVCARAVYACSMRACSCSDNELVYYEADPSESSLEPIEPKILVKPLPLAPLLAPLDGRRVPPQLLSRGEGDELLMCELFQARHTPFTYTPLRYTPRVSVQPLAAPCSSLQPLAAPCSPLQPLVAPCRPLQTLADPCRPLQPLARE